MFSHQPTFFDLKKKYPKKSNDSKVKKFVNEFYDFQKKIRLTNRLCVYNSNYIDEEFSRMKIDNYKVRNGIYILKSDEGQLSKTEHTWIEYKNKVIEPNFFYVRTKGKCIGYFVNGDNANFAHNLPGISFPNTIEEEIVEDRENLEIHYKKYKDIVDRNNIAPSGVDYMALLRDRKIKNHKYAIQHYKDGMYLP